MRLNKKQKMELAEKQYYQEAAEYVKNYPEELMRVLEDVGKLSTKCELYVKDNMFHVSILGHYESFILPYNIAVSPSTFKDYSIPFQYHPLEDLKCVVKRLQNTEKEIQIRQNKIQSALNKLTPEEKALLEIKL
jgi:hypothetical protein